MGLNDIARENDGADRSVIASWISVQSVLSNAAYVVVPDASWAGPRAVDITQKGSTAEEDLYEQHCLPPPWSQK